MVSNNTTFNVAGTTENNGVKTFRFSNGKLNLRANMLRHKGHTDIKLFELPKPMTQVQAIAWLLQNVRGTKGAVIATRAADKLVKSDAVVAGEALAAKQKERAAKREEKKAAKVAVAPAVTRKPKANEKVAVAPTAPRKLKVA